jgi:hypothetical protein
LSVRGLALEKKTPGAAIALLLTSDAHLSSLRDHGDASLESSDPLFMVFALEGFLSVTSKVVSVSKDKDIGNILSEAGSWFEVFVSADTMYLIFACLSMYIPHDLRETESTKTYVQELTGVIDEAYKSQRFEKDDIAKICMGIVAVSSLRDGKLDRVTDAIQNLEQSVRGYGGQPTFGAFYGLALIGQGLQQYCGSDVLRSVRGLAKKCIYRICGFLVEELLTCYDGDGGVFLNLVACLKSGTATTDLVSSFSDMEESSISLLMTKQVLARNLFISCAMCLPALSEINEPLFLASLRLLEAFEWGGGKGIAMPPMLRASRDRNIFSEAELSHVYDSLAENVEGRIEESRGVYIDSEGLDDLFYAYNGASPTFTSHLTRKTLVGNRKLFDEDGCVLSLLGMFVSLAPIPCLGGKWTLNLHAYKRFLLAWTSLKHPLSFQDLTLPYRLK